MKALSKADKDYYDFVLKNKTDGELQEAILKFRKKAAHYAASADYLNKALKRRRKGDVHINSPY